MGVLDTGFFVHRPFQRWGFLSRGLLSRGFLYAEVLSYTRGREVDSRGRVARCSKAHLASMSVIFGIYITLHGSDTTKQAASTMSPPTPVNKPSRSSTAGSPVYARQRGMCGSTGRRTAQGGNRSKETTRCSFVFKR